MGDLHLRASLNMPMAKPRSEPISQDQQITAANAGPEDTNLFSQQGTNTLLVYILNSAKLYIFIELAGW